MAGLSCNRNLETLARQIREFGPSLINCNGSEAEKAALPQNGWRDCALDELVTDDDVDVVVTATVGDVAIGPTLAAIGADKQIALANKETIVMAGELVTGLAAERGVDILPLDSEPNAIWQCIRGESRDGAEWSGSRLVAGESVSKLIITASGGAFRDTPLDQLGSATPAQALKHPTWKMGAEDYGGFSDADEQGVRGDRGALAVRRSVGQHRDSHTPAEHHPLYGRVRGRLDQGPAKLAGYASADTVRADVSGPAAESACGPVQSVGRRGADVRGAGPGAISVLRHGYRLRAARRHVVGGAQRRERRGG